MQGGQWTQARHTGRRCGVGDDLVGVCSYGIEDDSRISMLNLGVDVACDRPLSPILSEREDQHTHMVKPPEAAFVYNSPEQLWDLLTIRPARRRAGGGG